MASNQPLLLLRHTPSFRITLQDVVTVADGTAQVHLAPDTRTELARRRLDVTTFVTDSNTAHYGFNRGFGHNQSLAVPKDTQGSEASWWSRLQHNLILSHSCGVGDPLPRREVRAAMFLRAVSLARGHSGVRPEIVERLLDMLNENIVPRVPRFGSVGASGDLAPLSHIALAMIGQSPVNWNGEDHATSGRVFQQLGWKTLTLEMKEGLALNNGVQVSTAIGFLALQQMRTLLENAALATSLSAQVMLGADTPFRADLHMLRPHPGALLVSSWIWQLMEHSPIRRSHRRVADDNEVQDPYNLRCAGQVLGACADLLEDARVTLEIEANSVTDNPVILPVTKRTCDSMEWGTLPSSYQEEALREHRFIEIVSGGHFHGMPVAVKLYGLVEAMGILARLSNMRAVRYVDEHRNKGLGADLKWPELTTPEKAISSALMIPEYVSAALTNWIWGAAMPTHLFSLSTDAGQEDHVSMAPGVALRLLDTLPRVAEVLAVEFIMAAQAAGIRKTQRRLFHRDGPDTGREWNAGERFLSPAGEAVLTLLGGACPMVTQDRPLSENLEAVARLVTSGDLVAAAHQRLEDDPPSSGAPVFPSWGWGGAQERASVARYSDGGIVASYVEAEWPDFLSSPYSGEAPYAERLARRMVEFVTAPPNRILDVGGATGRLLRELHLQFPSAHLTLIERSPVFCDLARRMLLGDRAAYPTTLPSVASAGRPESSSPGRWPDPLPSSALTIRNVALEEAKIPLASQDVVVCANVVDRHPRPASAVERLFSFLTPGGHLMLATPFDWSPTYTPEWYWVNDLRSLLPVGVSIVGSWDEDYTFRYHDRHSARFRTQVVVARRTT